MFFSSSSGDAVGNDEALCEADSEEVGGWRS